MVGGETLLPQADPVITVLRRYTAVTATPVTRHITRFLGALI